jgi:hypothetical protein
MSVTAEKPERFRQHFTLYPDRKDNDIMKTQLHKLVATAVLGLALVSQSFPVWAGLASFPEVVVESSGASGSMAGARYSADSQQYIGCQFSNTYGPYIICSATDKNGRSYFCTGYGPHVAAAARSITDFSFISFGAAIGFTCDNLKVDNYSYLLQ